MRTCATGAGCSGACECGSRRTLVGGMVESAHGERARATVSMRPCSASCCVREAAWRGVFKVRKTFAFECGKTRGLALTREFVPQNSYFLKRALAFLTGRLRGPGLA